MGLFAACGRTFLTPSASFHSPEYDEEKYTAVKHELRVTPYRCVWRIEATHGEIIALNITQMDIGHTKDCLNDYLEIRDGHWHKSPLLGTNSIQNVSRKFRFLKSPSVHLIDTFTIL